MILPEVVILIISANITRYCIYTVYNSTFGKRIQILSFFLPKETKPTMKFNMYQYYIRFHCGFQFLWQTKLIICIFANSGKT